MCKALPPLDLNAESRASCKTVGWTCFAMPTWVAVFTRQSRPAACGCRPKGSLEPSFGLLRRPEDSRPIADPLRRQNWFPWRKDFSQKHCPCKTCSAASAASRYRSESVKIIGYQGSTRRLLCEAKRASQDAEAFRRIIQMKSL